MAPTTASRRGVRGTCVGCQRPYGRRRAPQQGDGTAAALLTCDELWVCDQCWHVAGGRDGVQMTFLDVEQEPAAARDAKAPTGATGAGSSGDVEVDVDAGSPAAGRDLVLETGLEFPPAVQRLLAAADEYDLLHPIDRLLVSSGVRWAVLRHIAVPARMRLAARILERTAAAHTAAAPSALVWLDAVDERIAEQSGTEFRYRCKKRSWRAIAAALSSCADREGRPLTWVTQDEIAAVVGCGTRTVSRCLRWLKAQDLLLEVVSGCKLPQQHVPDGETPIERAERLARLAQAVAAEEAAMARARRELDAVRGAPLVLTDSVRAPVEQLTLAAAPEPDPASRAPADPGLDQSDPSAALVNLAPVYELRIPRPPDELLAQTPFKPGPAGPDRDALTSTNTAQTEAVSQNVFPPVGVSEKDLESNYVQPVDKRRAPRGSQNEVPSKIISSVGDHDGPVDCIPAAQTACTQQSRAVEVAQWLLRKKLDVRLCTDVSVRWLAAVIRSSRLLEDHEWTPDDLLDLLHGHPEHLHLPRYIREPRAWIRARFGHANPTLSPTKLRLINYVEWSSPYMVARVEQERQRRLEQERQRQADERAAQRAAIAACGLCDEIGWLQIGLDGPLTRCTHHAEDGGY